MLDGDVPGDAGFVLPLLRPGMRVLDVGCGLGAVTLGFGTAVHPVQVLGVDPEPERLVRAGGVARRRGISTVDFAAGAAFRLPVQDTAFDVVFAHALIERTKDPGDLLAELFRVLRPGGTLALSTSDWSRAKLRPRTANVDAALRGYFLLLRARGEDPFAGRRVAEHVERAGFGDVRARSRHRPGLEYRVLAERVESGLAEALRTPGAPNPQLASAARSAWSWARGGGGEFSQCWTELVATRGA
ncbi:class I SAM-dependent methyltransferase [Amycolatopsis palatopharyngis]|uniref:class I SAM-dependent methyltransferase n=1 Tax=Amycolatopsis palatopharyngis TaxID=187982 RepID=UPI001FEC89A6|nr:methyltransferase domain-containing protein [Amycolatopsis palatopharyngis]